MGVFLDQKLSFCYTYSMKNLIVIATVLLMGCSALKTTDQRNGSFNAQQNIQEVAYFNTIKEARLRMVKEKLQAFPQKSFDIQVGTPQLATQNQLLVPVKVNFNQDWLMSLWQLVYAVSDENGGMSQITVHTVYDIAGPDRWNTADVVRGTAFFIDTNMWNLVTQTMVSSRPNLRVTLIDQQNRVISTQIVDMPALSHSYTDQTTPVFVQVGPQNDFMWWPLRPGPRPAYRMQINGDQPISITANIMVDSSKIKQVARVHVDIVRQN
jgi:predicted nucleic acid-binding protein